MASRKNEVNLKFSEAQYGEIKELAEKRSNSVASFVKELVYKGLKLEKQ